MLNRINPFRKAAEADVPDVTELMKNPASALPKPPEATLKGGTGSGYASPHVGLPGHWGGSQPRKSGGVTASAPKKKFDADKKLNVSDLYKRIYEQQGFTYFYKKGQIRHRGYAVSIYPQDSRIFPVDNFTPYDLFEYVLDKREKLMNEKNAHLGAWLDPESNQIFLDISVVMNDLEQAKDFGCKYNQIAIFDLWKLETITLDCGKQQKEAIKRWLKKYSA